MKKIFLCLPTILLLLVMVVNAPAYVYEQLPFSTAAGLVSSPKGWGYPIYDYKAVVYDDFTPTSSFSINWITWWGFHTFNSSGGNTFQYTFYADNGSGSPGSVLKTYDYLGSPSIGVYTLDKNISIYSIQLDTPFLATANNKYWISIYNGADNARWGWQKSDNSSGAWQTVSHPTGDVTSTISNVAFRLSPDAPVPIPAAAWLLASGLIGLVVIRRRFRKL